MCFGCSKEPSHRDVSFEYPQHMFWLRNKKNNFLLHTLIWGPDDSTIKERCFYWFQPGEASTREKTHQKSFYLPVLSVDNLCNLFVSVGPDLDPNCSPL